MAELPGGGGDGGHQAQRMGVFMAPRHWWERAVRDVALPLGVKRAIKQSAKGFGYQLQPWPKSNQEV